MSDNFAKPYQDGFAFEYGARIGWGQNRSAVTPYLSQPRVNQLDMWGFMGFRLCERFRVAAASNVQCPASRLVCDENLTTVLQAGKGGVGFLLIEQD